MSDADPVVLAVDTASSCSSIALTQGDVHNGTLIATLSLNSKVTHSRRLLSGIDWLLKENSIKFADIAGLAVGLGPGSFTGLRIGMATMKGMATAMGKPLLGVSTLDGLALNCSGDTLVGALLDARKKEVYRRWYRQDNDGICRPVGSIEALTPESFVQEISKPCQLVGDGVFVCEELLQKKTEELITIAPKHLHTINAASIAFLCAEQLHKGEFLDLDSAVPLYIRASDAELNLQQKKKQKK